MELRQLEYLMAVVEEGSFTRAAARVHISQSGVSAQIRLLERELGQTLLDRAARTVRPTAAGLAILPSVREALAGVEGARRTADELAGMVRGRVTVGMVTACTVEVLFDALARFHLRYPQIEISLREDSSDRLIDGVRAGVLDLALAGTSQDLPSGVESDVVSDEQLVVAIPAGHPLAERRRIGLEELMDYPLITLPPGAGVRNSFDKACGGRGLTARIGLQASAPDVVAGLAERGLGVAILTDTMAAARARTLRAVPIDDPPLRSRLELAWPTGERAGTAARICRQAIRDAFAASVTG
jgi:DNA-binding transcriptional LysR family regulator